MESTKSESKECIEVALCILGDKWTPLLIKELTYCPQKFSDLEKTLAGISPRTLSQRLNKLVDYKIIVKQEYCQHPPRYTYKLTEKGADLRNILTKMAEWGDKYQA